MCEVAECFENDELVVFSGDPQPSYANGLESEGTDDSKSDFPEAECALALLELAQSFVLMSSIGSLSQIGSDPAPSNTTVDASNVHFNNHLEDHAATGNASQHTTTLDEFQPTHESDFWTTQNCCHQSSVLDLLSVVRLDHSYETRRSHATGSICSGNKVSKKAKSATAFDKFRKIRKRNSNRKTLRQNVLLEDKQTAPFGSGSSPQSYQNNQAAVSHVKPKSRQLPNTNALKEVPLEKPYADRVSILSKAKSVFSIRGKRKLSTS